MPAKITTAPAKPLAANMHSFGLSFVPSIGPSAAQRRAKADADTTEARHKALPPTVAPWAKRLTLIGQEALAAVQRLYAENGNAPVSIPRATLAKRLDVSPERAEKMLEDLVKVGAVTQTLRFNNSPSYVPVSTPPAPPQTTKKVTKADAPKRPDPSAVPRLRSALGISSRW
jgi:ribosomal protein S25